MNIKSLYTISFSFSCNIYTLIHMYHFYGYFVGEISKNFRFRFNASTRKKEHWAKFFDFAAVAVASGDALLAGRLTFRHFF